MKKSIKTENSFRKAKLDIQFDERILYALCKKRIST